MPGQPASPTASAEKRYRALLDRRDHEARLADEARAKRDLLAARRRELVDEARSARAQRDALSDEARRLEEQARALFAHLPGAPAPRKRGAGGREQESDADRLARLDGEVAAQLRDLETRPMPLAEEKATFEQVRRKRREADGLRKAVAEAGEALSGELGPDVPSDPDELRREVERLRAEAQQLRQRAQSAHEDASRHSGDIDGLTAEADTHHKRVLAHRERADELHGKAMKMRELVIAERAKRKAQEQEAAAAVREQAGRVRDALYDETRIAAEEDEAVAALRSKRRLTL
ncbi:MAG TPA: hypothetical protein VGB42_10280 [Candidatus Thermoplasmatota archaeon]